MRLRSSMGGTESLLGVTARSERVSMRSSGYFRAWLVQVTVALKAKPYIPHILLNKLISGAERDI